MEQIQIQNILYNNITQIPVCTSTYKFVCEKKKQKGMKIK